MTTTKTPTKTNGTGTKPALITEVEALLERENECKSALGAAEKKLAQSEQLVDVKRRELAAAESKHFSKTHEMLPDDAPEAKAFHDSQMLLERVRATTGGLKRSIADEDINLLSTSERLSHHRKEVNSATVKAFVTSELVPAQKTYSAVLRRAHALATALDIPISVEESQKDGSLASFILRPIPNATNWQADAQARELHDQHATLKEMSDALEQHRKDSVTRVMASEQRRKDIAPFNPDGRYQVTRRFMGYGKAYESGMLISSHDLPLSLLQKLYSAGSLKQLERHDEYQR